MAPRMIRVVLKIKVNYVLSINQFHKKFKTAGYLCETYLFEKRQCS